MRRIPAFEYADDRPRRVLVEEPDMAAYCDRESEGEEAEDGTDIAVAGAVLNEILEYVIGRAVTLDLASSFRRFVAVVWLLRPEFLHEASLAQLAPQLSVTRAALSKAARRFSTRTGLRSRLQRSEETRRKCAAAQRANHWRRRKRKRLNEVGTA